MQKRAKKVALDQPGHLVVDELNSAIASHQLSTEDSDRDGSEEVCWNPRLIQGLQSRRTPSPETPSRYMTRLSRNSSHERYVPRGTYAQSEQHNEERPSWRPSIETTELEGEFRGKSNAHEAALGSDDGDHSDIILNGNRTRSPYEAARASHPRGKMSYELGRDWTYSPSVILNSEDQSETECSITTSPR